MQPSDVIFFIIVLIFSAVIHEVMHGAAADWLGDKTARYAGRLTLNPIPHLDPVGSVLLPIIFAIYAIAGGGGFFFAWAKPVPYNPYNLRPGRFSEAIVAFAGPLSNFLIAAITGGIIRLNIFSAPVVAVLFIIVVVNTMLCLFNLIPIPPLDGSKILSSLLPSSLRFGYDRWRGALEMNPTLGMGLVLIIILVLGSAFGTAVFTLARLIAGL